MDNKAALRTWVEERVDRALVRFEERVHSIAVRLEDVTGPVKGGFDKRCRLDVRLKAPAGQVIIDELGQDVGVTVSLALDRLKAAMSRKAGKAKRGVGRG
jgi:ribosome-associated translation inhibitor RaiA